MPRNTANANAHAFLAAYRITGNITAAAKDAKIEKTMHYRWLRQSAKYGALFQRARAEVGDMLEEAAIQRANLGVLEPVFYQGIKCGAVRRYPEGLMMFLLRGLKPAAYAQKAELTGVGGGPITIAPLTVEFVRPKDLDPATE